MDFRELRYFLAIVDHKSFSAAAKALHVSQPPLSQCILRMEERYGVQLLYRNTNAVTPTGAGEQLYGMAKDIVARAESLERHMLELASANKQNLRVGISQFKSKVFLPGVLALLRNSHAALGLTIIERDSPALEQLLIAGEIDLGIVSLPLAFPGLEYENFLAERLLLALPSSHPLAVGISKSGRKLPAIPLATLGPDEPFLWQPKEMRLRQLTEALFARHNFHPSIVLESKNVESLLAMVAAGMGMALVPESAKMATTHGRDIVFAVVQDANPTRTLVIARKASQKLTPPMEEFIAVLRDYWRKKKL